MSIEENQALYRRWMDAVNKADWHGMNDVLSAEFAFHNPSTPTLRTRDGYTGLMMAMNSAFPPGRWSVEEMVAEGDRVVGWMTFRGVHERPYRGVAPTGKEIVMECVCVARFAAGRIVEAKVVADSLGLLVTIGGLPVPIQPTR